MSGLLMLNSAAQGAVISCHCQQMSRWTCGGNEGSSEKALDIKDWVSVNISLNLSLIVGRCQVNLLDHVIRSRPTKW